METSTKSWATEQGVASQNNTISLFSASSILCLAYSRRCYSFSHHWEPVTAYLLVHCAWWYPHILMDKLDTLQCSQELNTTCMACNACGCYVHRLKLYHFGADGRMCWTTASFSVHSAFYNIT